MTFGLYECTMNAECESNNIVRILLASVVEVVNSDTPLILDIAIMFILVYVQYQYGTGK